MRLQRRMALTTLGLALASFTLPGLAPAAPPAGETSSWAGKLADADCLDADPKAPCPLTEATLAYAIVLGPGKSAKFDSAGNQKAEAALAGKKQGNPAVAITGSADGDTVMVKSLEVR